MKDVQKIQQGLSSCLAEHEAGGSVSILPQKVCTFGYQYRCIFLRQHNSFLFCTKASYSGNFCCPHNADRTKKVTVLLFSGKFI